MEKAPARRIGRPSLEEADELKERLLECALDMLCEQGVEALAMDRLAERADVTKRTIYRQFRSKLSLVEAVVDCEIQRLERALADVDVGGEDVIAMLEAWARSYFLMTQDGRIRNFVTFLSFEQHSTDHLAASMRLWMSRVAAVPLDLIAQAQSRQLLDRADPHVLTILLLDLLEGTGFRMNLGLDVARAMGGQSPDEFFNHRWASFLLLAVSDADRDGKGDASRVQAVR